MDYMNYKDIQGNLAADMVAGKKHQDEKELSFNEAKLRDLEKQIEVELNKVKISSKKGCFGKLVRLSESPICGSCADAQACEAALLKNGADLVAMTDGEIEEIVISNELNTEMMEMSRIRPTASEVNSHPILKLIYDAAEKIQATTAKPEPEKEAVVMQVPKDVESIDLSDMGKRVKVEFDFNTAKNMILTERPTDFKRVRQICLNMVDKYWHSATAYNNANKIMARLQELGVCGWDSALNQITYNI